MDQGEAELIAGVLAVDQPQLSVRAEKVPDTVPIRWRVVGDGLQIDWGCQYADLRMQGLANGVQQALNQLGQAVQAMQQNPATQARAKALATILLPGQ